MIFIIVLVVALGILIGRTLMFKPIHTEVSSVRTYQRNASAVAQRLSQMIQVQTISYHDPSQMNEGAFKAFQALLEDLYPHVHRVCERTFHGKRGILYKWQGENEQDPVILMSHYDVVPCNEELWSTPPFSGKIDETHVWGRGTLDTKSTLCGILEAAESLMNNGFVPENDVYFSFSGDEEISGESAPAIVDFLDKIGVKPSFVLDEGGAIVENVFPGVQQPVAVVGTGEKGYMDLLLRLKGQGGHSSSPPPSSLLGTLSKAVVKLEQKPFKARLTLPVKEMFNKLGRHSQFHYRLIFANLWLFEPILKRLFAKRGGEMNALIRTTTAVTMMNGSKAFNVLPPYAEVGVNFRLLPGDTVSDSKAYVKDLVNNSDIDIIVVEAREASPISETESIGWEKIEKSIHETWNGVVVSPYLMLAASDSRHFCKISKSVLRFSAMPLSSEERALIHGNDERIKISSLLSVVDFYENLMIKL